MKYKMDLPEFMRTVWVSEQARSVWEPRIQAVSRAWEQIERLAVLRGIRPAALQVIAPEQLPEVTLWAQQNNLVAIPIATQGFTDGYSAATIPVKPGGKFTYRVVIGNMTTVNAFLDAWNVGDDNLIGFYLGYPDCCRQFFLKYWKSGWIDTTYPMVGESGTRIQVAGPTECNILLRWLGIRFVSHLPCRFDCHSTMEIGTKIGNLGRDFGFVDEMSWLHEMLEWPIRWDSSHGVAIITTPCFRIVTYSTPLKERVLVERNGTHYPEEGARGIEFPFQNIHKVHFLQPKKIVNVWGDNGFPSLQSMDRAHKVVLSCVPVIEGGVLDLGCGNGILLDKIKKQNLGVRFLSGVDSEDRKMVNKEIIFSQERIINFVRVAGTDFELTLISEQRFLELPPEQQVELIRSLQQMSKWLIVYNYNTWKGTVDRILAEYFHWTDGQNEGSIQAHLLRSKHDKNNV